MSKKEFRLGDVADKAEVSITTVSHALRGTRPVSEGVRRRIESAMHELGTTTVGFVRRGTGNHSIGLIIDSFDPFFVSLFGGVLEITQKASLPVSLQFTDGDHSQLRLARQRLATVRPRGVIISPTIGSYAQFRTFGIPTTFVGRRPPDLSDNLPDTTGVYIDNEVATRQALMHLAEEGHKRIGLLTEHPGNSTLLKGYVEGLKEASLPIATDLIAYDISSLMERKHPATAIITGSYRTTLSVLTTLDAKKLNIPRDIGMVGFDFPYGGLFTSHLPTIQPSGRLIGNKAGEILIGYIMGEKIQDKEFVIPSSFKAYN